MMKPLFTTPNQDGYFSDLKDNIFSKAWYAKQVIHTVRDHHEMEFTKWVSQSILTLQGL